MYEIKLINVLKIFDIFTETNNLTTNAFAEYKRELEEEKEKLNALLPVAIDEYQLTKEEVFLNEMEDKKYDITKIFE